MEYNEQTELISKIETDSPRAGWQLVGEGQVRGGGIDQKGKRTHGHGQQCGDGWGEQCIRGVNGNGKSTIKIRKLKRIKKIKRISIPCL